MNNECDAVRVIIVSVCQTADKRNITSWYQNRPYRMDRTTVRRFSPVEAYRRFPTVQGFAVIYPGQNNLSRSFDSPDYPDTFICPIGKQGGAGSQSLTFRTCHRQGPIGFQYGELLANQLNQP